MAKVSKVLQFDDRPAAVVEAIGRFRADVEAERRSGWLGLKALFFKGLPQEERDKLDRACQVIAQLAMDMSEKGRVHGRLDLSGFRQKEKLRRTTRSAAGREKSYYRDYWLSCRLRSVDGSELRLVLGEDVKEKRGSATRKPRLSLKLIPNARCYTVKQPDNGILNRTYPVTIEEMLVRPESIRLAGSTGSYDLTAPQIIRVVREAYGCLSFHRVLASA